MSKHTPTRTTDPERISLAFPDRPADHKIKLPLTVDHHRDGAHDADGVSIFVTNPCGGTEYAAHIVRAVNAHEALVEALEEATYSLELGKATRARKVLALARGKNDG